MLRIPGGRLLFFASLMSPVKSSLFSNIYEGSEGMSWLSGIDIELDAVGRQFEPYPYRQMRLHAGGALVV